MKQKDFRNELLNRFEIRQVYDFDLQDFSEELKESRSNIPALYRYSPADYNNIRNLETQKIFLSNVGSMNDIFEGLSSELDADSLKSLDNISELVYLKSFSENRNDLKMWSQYGAEYFGMCVEYDLTKMNNSLLYHFFPIVYSNERIAKGNLKQALSDIERCCNKEEIDTFFLEDVVPLFLIKPKCWENEKEWRLIFSWLHLNRIADEIILEDEREEILFSYDAQLIDFPYAKAVYMGPKMPQHIKAHIAEIADKLHIPAYEMILSKTEYKLEEVLFIKEK